jgi:Ca2+-binding EF-hand superfamily protein
MGFPVKKALTPDQISDLEDAFTVFDEDGDGEIGVEELELILNGLGESADIEELETRLREVDDNQDGYIDFAALVTLMTRRLDDAETYADLKKTFDQFDEDEDGAITADELQRLLGAVAHRPTSVEAKRMVATFDRNGDGAIDYDEFLAMMAAD